MHLGEEGGAIMSSSIKQKLNTRSSTEAELIAVDDFMLKILWTQNFLNGQQFPHGDCILSQDNASSIVLANKGFDSAGKRMRHMNIRFFFARDCVSRGLLRVEYKSSKETEADYFSKPLQGKAFLDFRTQILGQNLVTTTSAVGRKSKEGQ